MVHRTKRLITGKICPFGNPLTVPASKVIFDPVNYGVITIGGKTMLDLYKQFKDWLDYNYPGTKLEPLQEDLMKIALRNPDTKVPKTASKAILRELAKLIITAK